jgi:hypothetical protein
MNALHQWRDVKTHKRFGRGHQENGIATTGQGKLTVLCRACPQPGINLPAYWEKLPDQWVLVSLREIYCRQFIRWKYAFLLAFDANFKQKARLLASRAKDMPLSPGCSVQVHPTRYEQYIKDAGGLQEDVRILFLH